MDVFHIYYIVSLIFLFILFKKYRRNLLAILIILIAFTGTIAFWIPRGTQMMNVLTSLISTYLVIKNNEWRTSQKIRQLVIVFVVFSLYFIISNLKVHAGDILFILSQYSKYYVPFTILLQFIHYGKKNIEYLRYFNQLWLDILLIQVFISICKFFLLGGHFWEGMVGTFGGLKGGGAGTSFPLMALCWIAINTNMDIRKWTIWLLMAGLLLLGIAAGKRAVILLFPILFLVLSIYVCRKKYSNRFWMLLVMVPLFFYFGIRLTPSFNPENKVWGSFNLEYVFKFTKHYSTGRVEEGEVAKGRIGSVNIFWNLVKDSDNYSAKLLLGEGVERAYTSIADSNEYGQFGVDYGLNHRGDITGILMLTIAIGLIGVLLLIMYYMFLFRLVKYKRFRWLMFVMVMFDFIFYNATMMRNVMVSNLMMFLIVYSWVQYSQQGKYVGDTIFNKIKYK